MRVIRIKLLITLILVAVASITLSTSSSALTSADRATDPSWIVAIGHPDGVDLNGEPEAGGGSAPPPAGPQGRYGAGQQRGEEPVSAARIYSFWLTWSRVLAARLWSVTY